MLIDITIIEDFNLTFFSVGKSNGFNLRFFSSADATNSKRIGMSIDLFDEFESFEVKYENFVF
jgi:hypothetical protein